jgi:hypothetical protein
MHLAFERGQLTAVALELLALGCDDRVGRVRDEPLVPEHALRARDLLPQPLDLGVAIAVRSDWTRSGRTTAAKILRSSSEPSSTWTPLRRKICAASWTRSSAAASAANRSSGSGQGETISRDWRAGSCDQISSVT